MITNIIELTCQKKVDSTQNPLTSGSCLSGKGYKKHWGVNWLQSSHRCHKHENDRWGIVWITCLCFRCWIFGIDLLFSGRLLRRTLATIKHALPAEWTQPQRERPHQVSSFFSLSSGWRAVVLFNNMYFGIFIILIDTCAKIFLLLPERAATSFPLLWIYSILLSENKAGFNFWDFLKATGKTGTGSGDRSEGKRGQSQLLLVLNAQTPKTTHEKKVASGLCWIWALVSCCEAVKHLEWQQQFGLRQLHSCLHQGWKHMKGLCHDRPTTRD